MGVDGNWIRGDDLYAIGHTKAEYGNFDTAGNLRSEQLFGEGNATAGWTYAEGYVSGFNTDSSTLGTAGITATKWSHWDYNNKAGNPSRTASTRASRWGVELGLERGVNTAFDVDDFVIEHAHGTSQEANGFYAISDFPDPETIVVQPITLWKGSRMANGSLKLITTETEQRPKFTLSAEFQDVPVTTYEDLRVLETWVKRGCLIAIRTKIDGIPEVMVGVIRVKRIPSSTWALSYCTFTLEFEEA